MHFWFADGDAVAGPGSLVQLPRPARERFANEQDVPCRFLLLFSPAGFERYFLELADALVTAQAHPADLPGAMARLRRAYGNEERSP